MESASLTLQDITVRRIKQNHFKLNMHAFISLVSLENVGCKFEANQCKLTDGGDPGWPPLTYFKLHLDLLNKIYAKLDKRTKNANFLVRQIVTTQP